MGGASFHPDDTHAAVSMRCHSNDAHVGLTQVMDRNMRLTGIITRKDVLPEVIEQKLVQPARHQV